MKSFGIYSTVESADLAGQISPTGRDEEYIDISSLYYNEVGMPITAFANGEAILDGGAEIGQLAKRGDILYNGAALYEVQSFIGCDSNGEESVGPFIKS